MNSFQKLNEIKLLKKEDFCSSLRDECVSSKDYELAEQTEFGLNWIELNWIWNKDNGRLYIYHDLYLKADVLLLADVFKGSRNVCL